MNKSLTSSPLTSQQKQHMTSRFPHAVNLSYETMTHKKDLLLPNIYDYCVAIPYGKRAFAWFSFFTNKNVLCILELTRENKFGDQIYFIEDIDFPPEFCLGTILSGTIYENDSSTSLLRIFLVDDIHHYQGIAFQQRLFTEKVGFLINVLQNIGQNSSILRFALPSIKQNTSIDDDLFDMDSIPYPIRHIQYRSSTQILPHMNISIHKKPIWTPVASTTSNTMSRIFLSAIADSSREWVLDINRPIYKKHCTFWVSADIAHDVYYLWCVKDNVSPPAERVASVKYMNLLIPNYSTSVMMNNHFRTIHENRNLDAVEESDDEDDFENIQEDKYVDLDKKLIIKCIFNSKFKKWVPLEILSDTEENRIRIPTINMLVRGGH